MGRYSTADEAKQEYINSLGAMLGSLYYELWNEVAWLNLKWEEYVTLFGTSPTRIDILNKSAPTVFRIFQDSLLENILLHISRLTDPSDSFGKKNLSIQSLLGLVEKEIEKTLSDQIDDVKEKTNFCRDWRNRYIAHRDLKLALGEQVEPLKPASRIKVKEALESIIKVLNIVSEHYLKSTVAFNWLHEKDEAENLLYIIDDGIQSTTDRQKRIEAGEYLPENLAYGSKKSI